MLVARLRVPPRDPKTGENLRSELAGEPFTPPCRAHEDDAGIDLFSSLHATVGPFLSARICHNLAVALPPGHFGLILARSSLLQNKGLMVIPGVIDPGFRGEVQTVVFNPSARTAQIQSGERISQLLILPIALTRVEITDKLPDPPNGSRNEKGFGSTGGFSKK